LLTQIKNGRHPILEATLPSGDIVPNDVFATHDSSHFQIIQGPKCVGARPL
jgi:DNA mismatch repair protein MSH4